MVHEVDKDSFEQSRHLLQNDIIWFCQHYSGSSYVMVNLKSSHKIGCGFRVSRIDFLEGRGLVAITILEWMNRSCKVNIRPSPCMQGTFLYKVCTERKVQQRRFWFLSAWTFITFVCVYASSDIILRRYYRVMYITIISTNTIWLYLLLFIAVSYPFLVF